MHNYEILLFLVLNATKETLFWNRGKERKNPTFISFEYYFGTFSNVGQVSNVNPKSKWVSIDFFIMSQSNII
jgi:hypothetical protein